MQTIPLQAQPNQTLSVSLAGQNCQIALTTRGGLLYADVAVSGTDLVRSKLCRDTVPLLSDYSGFVGNLVFIDQLGNDDPVYTGFPGRFLFCYLTAGEYAQLPA